MAPEHKAPWKFSWVYFLGHARLMVVTWEHRISRIKKPERALEVIQLAVYAQPTLSESQVWHLPENLYDVISMLTNEQPG